MTEPHEEKIMKGLRELRDADAWAAHTSDLLEGNRPALALPCVPLLAAGYVECLAHNTQLRCRHACASNPCSCPEYTETVLRLLEPVALQRSLFDQS